VIESAIDVVKPSADAKRIRIRTMLDSSVGSIRGDPNRLQQVLWNLLTNAVKFTPTDGRIQIVLERVESHVEITVTDTGIGIRPEFVPLVFDRFRQADPSSTRRHGGLGIGLSLVKNLVELHGGSVRVSSPGENRGTTFVVTLPIAAVFHDETGVFQSREPSPDYSLDRLELPRLDGISALIVDDESDSRTLVARILEEQGARVVCAASAAEALEMVQREPVDIVLSDIGMPDTNGYDLMRSIRTLDDARVRRIPAIALTAYARAEDRQRSLLAGYQLHISKPVETRELIAGLASLLNVAR
jgi:CheY-like chemotaxis protein/anti-sigma regulatory factor (Ser/Thr protein kinase)